MKTQTYGCIKSQVRPAVRARLRTERAQTNADNQQRKRDWRVFAAGPIDLVKTRFKDVINRMTNHQRVVWQRFGRPRGDALEAFLRANMWAHLRPKGVDVDTFLRGEKE